MCPGSMRFSASVSAVQLLATGLVTFVIEKGNAHEDVLAQVAVGKLLIEWWRG
jgi:hypothetical protein